MTSINNEFLTCTVDEAGIAIIDINQVNEPANLLSLDFTNAYSQTAQQLIKDESVKGVIVTSSRSMFMAGGDLRMLGKPVEDPKEFLDYVLGVHQQFRAIETGGKPFVAAISGTALGGGLELALSCHYRIAVDHPKIKIGLPESKVGLLPGGGGTVKLPYLMGFQNGLTYLLKGTEARPQQALNDGLIHALAESPEEMIAKAKEWILANPSPIQPWDDKKHKIPGGGFWTPNGVQTIMGAVGNISKMTHGNYPAQTNILKVVHDGLQVPIDRALEIEARYFTHTVMSPEAKNMIRTGFMGMQAAKKGKARPQNEEPYEIKRLGILGAGMMGAGIAYVSAKAGMEVVLKDVSVEGAEKGKQYSAQLMDQAIAKGRSTEEKKVALLSKITTSNDPAAVEGCDLVIEAVFEDPQLKDTVIKETEAVLSADKVFGSNTSTIPISLLAESSERPENFIGIHFFSPVDKMPLVEIIVGKKTSDKAIAAAVDYTIAINKIPIVVNDSRGFFTSRCFGTYVSEGMFLLDEGVPAATIENIARQKGMPVGPLLVHDEVSLTLSMHVYESNPDTKSAADKRFYSLLKDLVENEDRKGKKYGKGFYDYPDGGKKKLWDGLDEKYHSQVGALSNEVVAKRILHRQALESFRCLDEGVLQSVTDGDIGSVLGWGFPIYTGGSLSYIDYVGVQQFVDDCDQFAKQFGPRFEVPDRLRELAAAGESIHQFKKLEAAV